MRKSLALKEQRETVLYAYWLAISTIYFSLSLVCSSYNFVSKVNICNADIQNNTAVMKDFSLGYLVCGTKVFYLFPL